MSSGVLAPSYTEIKEELKEILHSLLSTGGFLEQAEIENSNANAKNTDKNFLNFIFSPYKEIFLNGFINAFLK